MHYTLSARDGKTPVPCDDIVAWGIWMGYAPRQVGFTRIGEATVGTAFVGIAEGFRDGRPILFETLVMGGGIHYPREEYCTWDEAEAGHSRRVALVSERSGFDCASPD